MTISPSAYSRPLVAQREFQVNDGEAAALWDRFCRSIQGVLPEQAYNTWFQPIRPVRLEDSKLVIQVPSRFYYDWIEGHYSTQIENTLQQTFGNGFGLVYTVDSNEKGDSNRPIEQSLTFAPVPSPARVTQTTAQNGSRGAGSSTYSGLNPRYVFDNFIEGPPNRFARAASLAVGASPGKTPYNPLLIYGGVGLGKTHLIQAIGHEALSRFPGLHVRYISSELFTQEFVESIKQNRPDEFSARYRQIDLLLLDDVQFLVGREGTQREFFHIFNSLHQSGKQIVLTSDKPPRELNGLDERLVSRIGWGLVCDIGPPDYDTRVAIIQKMAESDKIPLDSDVASFLAENITQNVRELQGAMVRLFAHASLSRQDLTLDLARTALRDLISFQDRKVTIDQVLRAVSDYYEVPVDLFLAKTRTQPIARARMIAMGICARLTGLSLKQIGGHFGGRDHTTVLHARQSLEDWSKGNDKFSRELTDLERRIQS